MTSCLPPTAVRRSGCRVRILSTPGPDAVPEGAKAGPAQPSIPPEHRSGGPIHSNPTHIYNPRHSLRGHKTKRRSAAASNVPCHTSILRAHAHRHEWRVNPEAGRVGSGRRIKQSGPPGGACLARVLCHIINILRMNGRNRTSGAQDHIYVLTYKSRMRAESTACVHGSARTQMKSPRNGPAAESSARGVRLLLPSFFFSSCWTFHRPHRRQRIRSLGASCERASHRVPRRPRAHVRMHRALVAAPLCARTGPRKVRSLRSRDIHRRAAPLSALRGAAP